jgi:hypothetical protein
MTIPIPDFLVLSPSLAAKLSAIVVHAEEMLSPSAHQFDRIALETTLHDPEVMDWIDRCGPLAPRKRKP